MEEEGSKDWKDYIIKWKPLKKSKRQNKKRMNQTRKEKDHTKR